MDITNELDKTQLYTMIGRLYRPVFKCVNGNTFDCITYKIIGEIIESGDLCAVNIIYKDGDVSEWVIFQYVLLDEIEDVFQGQKPE